MYPQYAYFNNIPLFLSPCHSLQSIQSEVVSREPSITSLNEVGKRLMSGGHDDGSAAEIQKDLAELNRRLNTYRVCTFVTNDNVCTHVLTSLQHN